MAANTDSERLVFEVIWNHCVLWGAYTRGTYVGIEHAIVKMLEWRDAR